MRECGDAKARASAAPTKAGTGFRARWHGPLALDIEDPLAKRSRGALPITQMISPIRTSIQSQIRWRILGFSSHTRVFGPWAPCSGRSAREKLLHGHRLSVYQSTVSALAKVMAEGCDDVI
jgi:hypothetical protein